MLRYFLISYIIGSVPFAYIWSRLCHRRDIREIGSRNVGTTNVMTNLGFGAGLLTLVGDLLKGCLAAIIGLLAPYAGLELILPAIAIAGHNWPVWLRFKGGGGLATFIGGGLIVASLGGMVLSLIIWGVSFAILRDHDRSALVACLVAPFALYFVSSSLHTLLFYGSSGAVIFVRRLQNMKDYAA